MQRLDKETVQIAIQRAKELVGEEHQEPFKTAAFQVVLTHLIRSSDISEAPRRASARKESAVSAAGAKKPTFNLSKGTLELLQTLKDPEKILLLWSFSDKEWMSLGEFLAATSQAGITLGSSWSHGGNFNNRLYRGSRFFVKKGKGRVAQYKLSDGGKKQVKGIIDKDKSNK